MYAGLSGSGGALASILRDNPVPDYQYPEKSLPDSIPAVTAALRSAG
jgi:hypothetical protein